MLSTEIMQKAEKYLSTAVLEDTTGNFGKARMSLALACHYELLALGFESILNQMSKSILPWTREIRTLQPALRAA
jgi:hypothetical protein